MLMPKYPNKSFEKKLWAEGFEVVAGVDEVGVGAWAGPLVAGACVVTAKTRIKGIRDSKLVTPKKREKLIREIKAKAVAWGVGIIEVEEVDQLGLAEAKREVFRRAVAELDREVDFLLLDGQGWKDFNLPVEMISKGDQKVFSIACASILAKVTRDRMMIELGKEFPGYGFESHKGYGSKTHQEALGKLGVSPIHRRSYAPIKALLFK